MHFHYKVFDSTDLDQKTGLGFCSRRWRDVQQKDIVLSSLNLDHTMIIALC